MAMLYGRRRLGKTYLLQRFCAGGSSDNPAGGEPKPHCYFLAEQTTAAAHRAALAAQILNVLPDEGVISVDELASSWGLILRHVSRSCREGERFCLILDEFPYLVEQSPELPSILQAWWDREGIHSRVFLILCGSQLSAMASLNDEVSPLFGRFNAGLIRLNPFRYDEVSAFYKNSQYYGVREILTVYGALGGTPRYHAMVDKNKPLSSQVIDLMMRPGSPLENEVRFLLGSQHIREPAPYNAVLGAIASGETQFGRIMQVVGTERGNLSFYLRTLTELGWVKKEMPFDETSERRTLYRTADPFLAFWYHFIAPLASALQFSDPEYLYRQKIEPYLPDYMGHVFEEVCLQWLRRHARNRLNCNILRAGRYWSRDGQLEIDLIAELEDKDFLFGECKWSERGKVGLDVYARLQAKVQALPKQVYRKNPIFVLFTIGEFTPELLHLASDPVNRLHLIGQTDLLAQEIC